MKIILFCCLSAFLIVDAIAQQQVISTSGNFTTGSSGSISWTLGESVVETFTANSQVLTQGFQQGNLTVNNLLESKYLNFEISAYPNPSSDYINLKIGGQTDIEAGIKIPELLYEISDLSGKIVTIDKLTPGNQQISLKNLVSGTYLLLVKENNNVALRIFKIIKQ